MNQNAIFERLAQLSPCAMAVFDREGNIQMWNPAAERLFGWRAEEVLNHPPPIIPEDASDGRPMRRWHDRKIRGDSFRDVELRPVRKDGSSVEVSVSAAPLRDDRGEVYGSVCVLTDVTERKRMESELEEVQRRLSAIVRLSPDAIWLKDLEGRYRLVNPAGAGIFDLRPEQVHGKTDRDLFAEEFAGKIEKADRRVLQTGAPFSREITLTVRGEKRTYLTLRYPYLSESQRLLGVIGIARDITRRKEMERELRETRNRLEALVRAAPVGIDIVDQNGRVRLWNPAAERLFGWREAEVLGGPPPMFAEERIGELRGVVREIIQEGRARSYRARRLRKDGSEIEVAVWAAPVVDGDGKIHGAVGCFLDVEERKRLEREHRRMSEILRHTPDPVLSVDAWGKVREMNAAARDLLGVDRASEVRRQPLGGYFLVDSWARLWYRGRAVALREGVWRGEGVMRGQNGDDLEVEVTLVAHREPEEPADRRPPGETGETAAAGAATPGLTVAGPEAEAGSGPQALPGPGPEALPGPRPEAEAAQATDPDAEAAQAPDPEALPGPDAAYGFSVLIRDVTEVRRLRRELSESRARYRRLFRQAPAALHSMNREERLVEVSDQWLEALGYERGEVIGRHPKELLTEESRRRAEEVELPRFWERGWARDVPYQFVRKDGELRDILLSSVVQRDEDGSPVGTLTVLNDVTERKAAERELTFRALHHPLTGLPNRALFRDRLAQALARSGRRKTRVAVLFVDLDRFKVVNDTLGHVAGDRLLRAVARRFAECMRAEDTLAHHGGDEFVVLLEGVEEEAAVVKVAERLTGTLQEPFEIAGSRLLVTASIGFALAGRGDPLDAILRNADVAMYRAKEEGGGSVHAYDPHADYQVTERLELETELQRALEEREFELHWQPVVELASGQPCMVEALVRWRHPRRGLLAPREFIGAAEESGIIVPLGEWVLETAGAQLREWKEAELLADCTALSVNLSARQLRQPGFREVVARVVEEGGFEPWRLQLEITESVLMESGPELEALKRMRVKLAIDDFGTGYSSLAYLKQFPVDALKIDRRFVEGLGRDPADGAICGAITAVAKSMNLLIIAEGVETPEQLEELKRLGCGWAQGYLFARPMPPGKMRKLLASKRKLA